MLKSDLDWILSELSAREPIFHRREFGTSREELLKMTADNFWEIGASGKTYDRDFVIENLLERCKTPEPDSWVCEDFSVRKLPKISTSLTMSCSSQAVEPAERHSGERRPSNGRSSFTRELS